MKKIAILGSTGSIGKNTLNVIKQSKGFCVTALSCHTDIQTLAKQIKEFSPKIVAVSSKDKKDELGKICSLKKTKIIYGKDAYKQLASFDDYDILVSSLVGAAGLIPTLTAISNKKTIALANKEVLVMAGDIVKKEAKKHKVKILPIDSEHSAIFQCIKGNKQKDIKKIYITASGGPFLKTDLKDFKKITVRDALNHPVWKMGKKISIDSATLMNKALEIIEAMYLFNLPHTKIDVLIHKESIIHSIVEYKDGASLAQLGIPDMKTAISYAISYPNRIPIKQEPLNLAKIKTLNFEEKDMGKFKSLEFAYRAAKEKGTMPTVMNAANEVAVSLFLNKKIRFDQIFTIINKAMNEHKTIKNPTIDDILFYDKKIRKDIK